MVPGVYGVTLSAEMLAAEEDEVKMPCEAEADSWRMAEAATRDWTCDWGGVT
jgi:hypothetical protein